jgi:hypothetical protein
MRVSKRTKTIILFLAGCIPQSEINHAPINLDSGGIVIKYSRDILSRELVLSITKINEAVT